MSKKKSKKIRNNKLKSHDKKTTFSKKSMEHLKTGSISLCMIVKDEERFLDNCLQSVKDIADEIIIVDTGSKDRTVNIAKKYTDRIFLHPWNDSFSEARNHYLKYAVGDWIFQIDADEELVKEDIPVLLEAVKNSDVDAIMVQIVSNINKGQSEARHNVERLFRNNGKIHYEGRVHNRLVGFKRPGLYPIRLIHYGYDLDKDSTEKKFQRRIDLLRMDLNENPDNPLTHHYISCAYQSHGLYREALESSLNAIGLAEKNGDENPIFLWSRYTAAMSLYKLKEYERAEHMAYSALKKNNLHMDSHFILTLLCYDQGKWPEVIHHSEEYIRLTDGLKHNPSDFGTIMACSANMAWNVLVLKGIACYELGDDDKAKASFRSAVRSVGEPFVVLRAIGLFYYNKGDHLHAIDYLQKAHEINPDDSTVINMLENITPKNPIKGTISCCMIVKNEEQFLEKCLASVNDYVDEIIVVDTGSTDNTVEIAKRFTDKVYYHPWENSFSKARNQALQYATCEWIFQIDGDEKLMAGSGEKLRKAVRDVTDEDIIYVKILCSYANGSKMSLHNFERLFRNNGVIHYEGAVHNRVVGGSKELYSEIELWHYGYDVEEDKAREKFERTTMLLKNEIEKNPENPLHHHYLSASYAARGMFEEAFDVAQRAIKLADTQNNKHPIYSWTHFIASMSLFQMNNMEQAQEYAQLALSKYPDHMDSFYMLSVTVAEKGDWNDALAYGRTFLELLKKHQEDSGRTGLVLNNTMNEGPAVHMIMGHSLHAKESYREMDDHYKQAYETTDDKWRVWYNIGTYHMDKSGDLKRAGGFLKQAVNEAPNEHDAWYMLAKFNNKCGLRKDELECLEKVVEIGTDDPFILNRLISLYISENMLDKAMGIIDFHDDKVSLSGSLFCEMGGLYFEKGEMEPAIKCYMNALEKDPKLSEAWSSLGEITLNLGRLEDSKLFFKKALTIKNADIGIMLTLCDIYLREGDLYSFIKDCDLLLKVLNLPHNKTINCLEDLKNIIVEMGSAVKDNKAHQDKINNILYGISQYQSQPEQMCETGIMA
ncbi:glycosyltransferase [Deltaproteobacteria bacterium]|nr:glycosyltransferase [Deltaproteobacteria bacterium]